MKRRIMKTLLAVGLVLSMTACTKTESGEDATISQTGGSETAEVSGTEEENGETNEEEDISREVTLKIYAVGNEGDKYQEQIYERINEITREKINAQIDVTMLSWGDYTTKLPAILASGEDYDLVYTSSWCYYKTEGPKGAFYELTEDLLKEYMPQTYEEYPAEAWEQAKLEGKIYMIPTVIDEFDSHGLIVRKDLREKYGVPEIKTMEDLGAYFAAIKENEPGMTPFKGQSTDNMDTMFCYYGIDELEASLIIRAGMQAPLDNPAGIRCKLEIPRVREFYKQMGEWYQAGYIANDILSSKTTSEDYFKAGQSSVMCCNLNNASEKRKLILADNPDWELEYVDFEGEKVMLTPYISNGMAVGRNSKNPERALMFMELCYQDEELYDLVNYGLEGITYIKNDDGTIETPKDVSLQEIQMDNLSMGIRYKKFKKVGREDIWEEIEAKKDDYANRAYTSPLIIMSYNLDELSAEIAAVNNVFEQYEMPMRWGAVKATDESLDELRQRYSDAGMDKLLENISQQIKEYLNE